MNPLNPFAISGILMGALYLPLSIFVIIKGRSKLARLYGGYLFSIAMWGLCAILIGVIKDIPTVKFVWKLAYVWALLIPPFFYHTSHEMNQRKTNWDIFLVYGQAIYFTIAIYQDKLISSFDIMFNSFYFHHATPTFTASFILWTIIITLGHVLFIKSLNKAFPQQKTELKNILNLTLIGFIGGITNFFPAYGLNIYPWGNFIAISPCLAITVAIFKFQFLDIKVVLRKSFAYSILILLAALLYFGTIIISEKFIQGFWGYKSITTSILIAFIIGVLFFPLHNYVQRLVDKLIFKKTTEEISNENEMLRAEVLKTEKLKSVAVLASGMAHEIKNPLTALKTFSEYLPHKLDDKEFLQKFSRIVGGEVNRIDQLVNELLEFARPAPAHFKPCNINKLITDTLDFLNSKFLQKNITVKIKLSPECNDPIMLDSNKIRQALLNIFLNAIDAMKPGGILDIVVSGSSLGASSSTNDQPPTSGVQPPTSNDQPQPPIPSIKITITDTGCGIENDKLLTIFDPFYSTKDSGTGLGLPITHGIIKNHGGEIKVASIVGQGTTFTLMLPRDRKNSP
jgi:signal transduction histidine kinase